MSGRIWLFCSNKGSFVGKWTKPTQEFSIQLVFVPFVKSTLLFALLTCLETQMCVWNYNIFYIPFNILCFEHSIIYHQIILPLEDHIFGSCHDTCGIYHSQMQRLCCSTGSWKAFHTFARSTHIFCRYLKYCFCYQSKNN